MTYQDMKIDYVELPASDMAGTRRFFEAVFGWRFTDYGPDYMAFDRQGVEGGFYRTDTLHSDSDKGAALIIFYTENLEDALHKVTTNGGLIKKEIFDFPGGRRFHFTCPSGNEFALWSDKPAAD